MDPGGIQSDSKLRASFHIDVENINVTSNKVNDVSNGGGGWFTFCKPMIRESLWNLNEAKRGRGGAIYFGTMSAPFLVGKDRANNPIVFTENLANTGGSISCDNCAAFHLEKATLSNNNAEADI